MKVLLLGVGNADARLNAFSIFFENLLDQLPKDCEVLTFGYNEGVNIRIKPEDPFEKVMASLPAGWHPDCCILQLIDWNLLPRGIEKAPCLVFNLLTPGDWDLDVLYSKAIVESSDVTVGAGHFDEENLPFIGADKLESFYMGLAIIENFVAREPKRIKDRKYDIFFTATWFDDLSAPQRSKCLTKLTELCDKYKLMIAPKGNYSDYISLLRESRIAFSTARDDVFSNRVIEAAAQGTISIATGRDIKRFFEDGKEFISVDENNIIERVVSFLDNKDILQEMSERVYTKVVKKFEAKNRFFEFLKIVQKNVNNKVLGIRRTNSLSEYDKCIRDGEVYYYAYFRTVAGLHFFKDRETSKYLQLIIDSFSRAITLKPTPRAKTNLAVALSSFLFLKHKKDIAEEEIHDITLLLKEVISDNPRYVMAYFNLGLLFYRLDDYENALDAFNKVTELLEDGTGKLDPWCLHNRDYGLFNLILRLPLNKNLLLLLKKEPNSENNIHNLYRFAALFFISLIHEERKDLYTSLETLRKAYNLFPSHGVIVKKMAHLLDMLGYREECLEMYEKATEMMPMDIELRLKKIKYLYLCEGDNDMVSEINNLKKTITIVKPLNTKATELKAMINSMGRFNGKGNYHDNLKELLLNSIVENLYLSLKRYPQDSKLVSRIVTIWQELGRLDKIFELLEDYIHYNKYIFKSDDNTLLLFGDIYKCLESALEARQKFFDEKTARIRNIIAGNTRGL